jgi:hypothetical protein
MHIAAFFHILHDLFLGTFRLSERKGQTEFETLPSGRMFRLSECKAELVRALLSERNTYRR